MPKTSRILLVFLGTLCSICPPARGQEADRPPVEATAFADAGGPYSAIAGQELMVSAVAARPADRSLEFAWNFGNGSFATGRAPVVTYERPGTYVITLLTTGRSAAPAVSFTYAIVTGPDVPAQNRPPTIIAPRVTTGLVYERLTLDASASSDPDGDPVTFAWRLGDGSASFGPTISYAYTRPGTYTVRLLATDGMGGARTATLAAVITQADYGEARNHPPEAHAAAPKEAFAGEPVTFDASGSSDPDGDNLRFTWVFDDGESLDGSKVSHVFATLAYHVVTLVVTDARGGVDSTSVTVDVGHEQRNAYPVADVGGPYTGIVNTPVSFKATASDPDGDELSFFWDFGDGARGDGNAAVSHTYASAGTYQVVLLVSDGNGDVTRHATTVKVNRAAAAVKTSPPAIPGGPYAGVAGKPITLSARTTADGNAASRDYTWSFGDGFAARGASVTHVYAQPGTYASLLLVTDANGGAAAALTTVTIGQQ